MRGYAARTRSAGGDGCGIVVNAWRPPGEQGIYPGVDGVDRYGGLCDRSYFNQRDLSVGGNQSRTKNRIDPPGRRMSVLCGDGVGHYFLTSDTSLGPYLERKFMPLFTMPKWIETWNRKIHIYLGLYFLFFLGLFSISGLVLNHPQWAFAQF